MQTLINTKNCMKVFLAPTYTEKVISLHLVDMNSVPAFIRLSTTLRGLYDKFVDFAFSKSNR